MPERKLQTLVRHAKDKSTSEQSQLYLEQQLKCHVIIAPAQKTQIAA
ncbi:MAG: hypothetical protein ACTSQI_04470 [Candidatus Helarchaeota archaeon]